MIKNSLLFWLSLHLVLLASCSRKDYDINIVCDTNEEDNYVIKWEIFPKINETVKIYRSDNPDNFTAKNVELELPVQEGMAILPKGPFPRSYFKLVFGKKIYTITSNRSIKAGNIINLRGLGGYYNRDNRQVKWGKIYRSGSLSEACKPDIALLKALHIKTAIDVRTDEEIAESPSSFILEQTFHLPLKGLNPLGFIKKVIDRQMKKGDTFIFQQDLQTSLITDNTDYFKRYFEILSDSSNYPLIIHCGYGKDRVGIVAALTLLVLDIDAEQVYNDYALSNSYMDFRKIVNKADTLSPEVQEALTSLLLSQRSTIEYAWKQIEKQHGSMDNYFEKELGLTNKKRDRLKELLLYHLDN